MSNVYVTMAFVLRCRQCGHEVEADGTAKYLRDGVERTAYFHPDMEGPPTWAGVVGTSDGTGDTFVCLACDSGRSAGGDEGST